MGNETEELKGWLSAAVEPPGVRRALGYAIAVGAILILLNHGDAVVTGNINGSKLTQMGLTVIVPYFVSTLSSVGATRARREEKEKSASRRAALRAANAGCGLCTKESRSAHHSPARVCDSRRRSILKSHKRHVPPVRLAVSS